MYLILRKNAILVVFKVFEIFTKSFVVCIFRSETFEILCNTRILIMGCLSLTVTANWTESIRLIQVRSSFEQNYIYRRLNKKSHCKTTEYFAHQCIGRSSSQATSLNVCDMSIYRWQCDGPGSRHTDRI